MCVSAHNIYCRHRQYHVFWIPFLQACSKIDISVTPITNIINISMETSTFPQNFKKTHVIILLKITSLPKSELRNYRSHQN